MENDEQRTKREGCEEALSRFFTSPFFLPAAAVPVLPVLLPVDMHNGSGHMPWSADLQAVFRKDVR